MDDSESKGLLLCVEQDARRLQCWLAPACVEDDIQRRGSEYLQGSGDWILQTEGFKKWYTSTCGDAYTGTDGSSTDIISHSMLQVIGRPGSGKSILAAYLVNHLSQFGRVVYFVFNTDQLFLSTKRHITLLRDY